MQARDRFGGHHHLRRIVATLLFGNSGRIVQPPSILLRGRALENAAQQHRLDAAEEALFPVDLDDRDALPVGGFKFGDPGDIDRFDPESIAARLLFEQRKGLVTERTIRPREDTYVSWVSAFEENAAGPSRF